MHAVILDVIRATIDVLIDTCIDGENAPGTGGNAVAQNFFPSASTTAALDARPKSTTSFPRKPNTGKSILNTDYVTKHLLGLPSLLLVSKISRMARIRD